MIKSVSALHPFTRMVTDEFWQALNYAHARYGLYGSILDSTKAVVFFGTPHQGADTAVWATFLGNVGKAVRLRNTEVVEELKRWSNPLVDLTRTFSELAPRFSVSTYFEKKTTNGILVSLLLSWFTPL